MHLVNVGREGRVHQRRCPVGKRLDKVSPQVGRGIPSGSRTLGADIRAPGKENRKKAADSSNK